MTTSNHRFQPAAWLASSRAIVSVRQAQRDDEIRDVRTALDDVTGARLLTGLCQESGPVSDRHSCGEAADMSTTELAWRALDYPRCPLQDQADHVIPPLRNCERTDCRIGTWAKPAKNAHFLVFSDHERSRCSSSADFQKERTEPDKAIKPRSAHGKRRPAIEADGTFHGIYAAQRARCLPGQGKRRHRRALLGPRHWREREGLITDMLYPSTRSRAAFEAPALLVSSNFQSYRKR